MPKTVRAIRPAAKAPKRLSKTQIYTKLVNALPRLGKVIIAKKKKPVAKTKSLLTYNRNRYNRYNRII